jgi:hypothetical protein
MMPSFDYFLQSNMARKMSGDPGMARSMLDRAAKRLEYLKPQIIDKDSAPFIFEQVYEVIRECGHCLMARDGYKPNNSHEAIIAYLADNYQDAFGEKLISDFNRFRVMRNDSVYNGENISPATTNKALSVAGDFVRITNELMIAGY